MEIENVVKNLINALNKQEYSFSEVLYSDAFVESFNYLSGTKKKISAALQSMVKISYDHIDQNAFNRDLRFFQQEVDERMLFAWGYKSGCLSIVGIIYADDLSEGEIQDLFTRLDNGVTNIMRKHTGHVSGGNDGGTYGTMMLVFSDAKKAIKFNDSISKYYCSHFLKSTYNSTISIDCTSETITQGKASLGFKWRGGIDISALKNQLFDKTANS